MEAPKVFGDETICLHNSCSMPVVEDVHGKQSGPFPLIMKGCRGSLLLHPDQVRVLDICLRGIVVDSSLSYGFVGIFPLWH